MKNANPDVVFIYLNEEESARILKELRKADVKAPLVGETTLIGQKVIELAGGAANGAIAHVGLTTDAPIPSIKAFRQKFVAKYNYVPDHNGIKGYLAVYMIKAATEKMGKIDSKDLAATLHGLTITAGQGAWHPDGRDDRRERRSRSRKLPWRGRRRQAGHQGSAAQAALTSGGTERGVMANFVALVIAGLATGALYALVAIGFTLLWQTSQTINFAQGEFVMLPAFFILATMRAGLPFWAAIIVGVLLSMAILGFAFKRLLVDPMLRHGVLPLAIATMALSTFMKESVKTFYSAEASPFPSIASDADLQIFGISVSWQNIVVLVVAIAVVVALQFLLQGTRTGRQMQAAAQNPTVARILGVPVERMILYAFLINGALVALASVSDLADLSREILQRRYARSRGVHRGDRRRLQPDPRRDRRRPCRSASSTIFPQLTFPRNIAARSRCSC